MAPAHRVTYPVERLELLAGLLIKRGLTHPSQSLRPQPGTAGLAHPGLRRPPPALIAPRISEQGSLWICANLQGGASVVDAAADRWIGRTAAGPALLEANDQPEAGVLRGWFE